MPSHYADSSTLAKIKEELAGRREANALGGEELAVLAECNFRLAVDPDTPAEEAFGYIQQAIRMDPGNPKHSYHLARLLFVHGQLDKAAEWLGHAQCLCPTSHRIWTHIALLQRELNERYRGKQEYVQDALRQRGDALLKRVQEGGDRVDPKDVDFRAPRANEDKEQAADASGTAGAAAPAVEPTSRFLDAGKCRWTGVYDLKTEDLLENDTDQTWLNSLREPIGWVASRAQTRRGGKAAFAVAAIEWLLAGYPVGFVRRVRPQTMHSDSASGDLLESACQLMEASLDDLPAMLAKFLDEGAIPALLAAMIHHRRMLGPPLRLKSLPFTYRSAAKLVNSAHPRRKEVYENALRALKNDARELIAASFPSLVDEPPEEAAQAEEVHPEEEMAQIEALAAEMSQTIDGYDQRIKALLPTPKTTLSGDALIEANRIRVYLRGIRDLCGKGLGRIDKLRKAGVTEEFAKALDAGAERFRDLQPKASPMLRKLASVPEVELPPEPETQAPQEGPAPPAPVVPAVERIAELNSFAAKIHHDLERYFDRLKILSPKPGSPPSSAPQEEIAAIRADVQEIPPQCQKALAEVDRIRPTVQSEEVRKALDAAQEAIRDISAKLGPVRRALTQFPDTAPVPEPAVVSAGGVPVRATRALPSGPLERQGRLEIVDGIVIPKERSALRSDLSTIRDKLSAYFQTARNSFAAYSKDARATLPLSALERSVRAREAEALYRLGEREDARRVWSGLAAEDALDYRLLRNIAVCDSLATDLRRPLRSWQAYVEALYFHAAAAGDTSRLAAERAAFHRDYGAAYGPAGFCNWDRKNSDAAQKVDPTALLAFLNDPVRVATLTDHLLLALFNQRLEFRSPAILLGVRRSATEQARAKAKAKLLKFLGTVEPMLPRRAGSRFATAARQRLDWAEQQCASAARLSKGRDPHYQDDERRLLHWIEAAVNLLTGIQHAIIVCPGIDTDLRRPDTLEILCRLEEICLDTSPDLLRSVAATHGDPEQLLHLMQGTKQWFFGKLMAMAFPKYAERSKWDEQKGMRTYARLTGELLNYVPDQFRAILDSPGAVEVFHFYPEEVLLALQSDEANPKAADVLLDLCRKYGSSAGLAYECAALLLNCKRFEEASKLLETAAVKGCTAEGRSRCAKLLTQLSGAIGG